MWKRSIREIARAACVALFLFVCGCGGGTSGTGTGERSFDGRVQSTDGTPVAGASVTIVETGESTITDTVGAFAILSDVAGTSIALLIEADTLSTTVQVEALDVPDTAVHVDVTVDEDSPQQSVSVKNLQVKAQVVGACDPFFENRRTIRQANRIKDGTVCSVKVQIYGDGKLLERIPFVIQHAACDGRAWAPVSAGETGFGIYAGVGTADFTFFNEPEFCLYRIVAPYEVPGLESVIYRIDTFLKQAQDQERRG